MSRKIEVITLMSSDEDASPEVQKKRVLHKKAREKEKRVFQPKVNNQLLALPSSQKVNINPSMPLNFTERPKLVNKGNYNNFIHKPSVSKELAVNKFAKILQPKSQIVSKNAIPRNVVQTDKIRNNLHREPNSSSSLGSNKKIINNNCNKSKLEQASSSQVRFNNNNSIGKYNINPDLLKIDSLKNKLEKIGVSVQSVSNSSANKTAGQTNSVLLNSQVLTKKLSNSQGHLKKDNVQVKSPNKVFQNSSKQPSNLSTQANVSKRKHSNSDFNSNYEISNKKMKYSNANDNVSKSQNFGCATETIRKVNENKPIGPSVQVIPIPFETVSKPKITRLLENNKACISNKLSDFTNSKKLPTEEYSVKRFNSSIKQLKANVKELKNFNFGAKISQNNFCASKSGIIRPGLQVIPVSQEKVPNSSLISQNSKCSSSSKFLASTNIVQSRKQETQKNCEVSNKNSKSSVIGIKIKSENTTFQKASNQEIFKKTGCQISIPGLEVITLPSAMKSNEPTIALKNSTAVKTFKTANSKHQETSFEKSSKNSANGNDGKSLKTAQEKKVFENKKVCPSPVVINVSEGEISQLKKSISNIQNSELSILANRDQIALERTSEKLNGKSSLGNGDKKAAAPNKITCLNGKAITITPVGVSNSTTSCSLDVVNLDAVSVSLDEENCYVFSEVTVVSESKHNASESLSDCEVVAITQSNTSQIKKPSFSRDSANRLNTFNYPAKNKQVCSDSKAFTKSGVSTFKEQDLLKKGDLLSISNKDKITSKLENQTKTSKNANIKKNSIKERKANVSVKKKSSLHSNKGKKARTKEKKKSPNQGRKRNMSVKKTNTDKIISWKSIRKKSILKKVPSNEVANVASNDVAPNDVAHETTVINDANRSNLASVKLKSVKVILKDIKYYPIENIKYDIFQSKELLSRNSNSSSNKLTDKDTDLDFSKSNCSATDSNTVIPKLNLSTTDKWKDQDTTVFTNNEVLKDNPVFPIALFKNISVSDKLNDEDLFINSPKKNFSQTETILPIAGECLTVIDTFKPNVSETVSMSTTLELNLINSGQLEKHDKPLTTCVTDSNNLSFAPSEPEQHLGDLDQLNKTHSNFLKPQNYMNNSVSTSVTCKQSLVAIDSIPALGTQTLNLDGMYQVDKESKPLATSIPDLSLTALKPEHLTDFSESSKTNSSTVIPEENINDSLSIPVTRETNLAAIDSLSMSITHGLNSDGINRLDKQSNLLTTSIPDLGTLKSTPLESERHLADVNQLNKAHSSILMPEESICDSVSMSVTPEPNLADTTSFSMCVAHEPNVADIDSLSMSVMHKLNSDNIGKLDKQINHLTVNISNLSNLNHTPTESEHLADVDLLNKSHSSTPISKESICDSASMSVAHEPNLGSIDSLSRSIAHKLNSEATGKLDKQSNPSTTIIPDLHNLNSTSCEPEQQISDFNQFNKTHSSTLTSNENICDSVSPSVINESHSTTFPQKEKQDQSSVTCVANSNDLSMTSLEENIAECDKLNRTHSTLFSPKINTLSEEIFSKTNSSLTIAENNLAVVNKLKPSVHGSVSMSVTHELNLIDVGHLKKQDKSLITTVQDNSPTSSVSDDCKNSTFIPSEPEQHFVDSDQFNKNHSSTFMPNKTVNDSVSMPVTCELNLAANDSISKSHESNLVGTCQLNKRAEPLIISIPDSDNSSSTLLKDENFVDSDQLNSIHSDVLLPKETTSDSVSISVTHKSNLAAIDQKEDEDKPSIAFVANDLSTTPLVLEEHISDIDKMNKIHSSLIISKENIDPISISVVCTSVDDDQLKEQDKLLSIDIGNSKGSSSPADNTKLNVTYSSISMPKENINDLSSMPITPELSLAINDQSEKQSKNSSIDVTDSNNLILTPLVNEESAEERLIKQLKTANFSKHVLKENISNLASICVIPESKLVILDQLEVHNTALNSIITHTNDSDSISIISKEQLLIENPLKVNSSNVLMCEPNISDSVSMSVTHEPNVAAANQVEKQNKPLIESSVETCHISETHYNIEKANVDDLNSVPIEPELNFSINKVPQTEDEIPSLTLEHLHNSDSPFISEENLKINNELNTNNSNTFPSKINEPINIAKTNLVNNDQFKEQGYPLARTIEKESDSDLLWKDTSNQSFNVVLDKDSNLAMSEESDYIIPVISEIHSAVVDESDERDANLLSSEENSKDSYLIPQKSNSPLSEENSNELLPEDSNLSQFKEQSNQSSSILDMSKNSDSITVSKKLISIEQLENRNVIIDEFKSSSNNSDADSIISITSLVTIDESNDQDLQCGLSKENVNKLGLFPIISEVHSGINKSNNQESSQLLHENNCSISDSMSLKSSEMIEKTKCQEIKLTLSQDNLNSSIFSPSTQEVNLENVKAELLESNLTLVEPLTDLPLSSQYSSESSKVVINRCSTDQSNGTDVNFNNGDENTEINSCQESAKDILEKEMILPEQIQVTSPKLSLKRKREHDLQIHTDVKRGLFNLDSIKVSKSDDESIGINANLSVLKNGAQNNDDGKHESFEALAIRMSKVYEENTLIKENDVISKDYLTNSSKAIDECHKVALSDSFSINTNGISAPSAESSSKEPVSLEANRKQFEELLDFCKQKVSPQEGMQMHQNIMNKYNRASEHYLQSIEFNILLNSTFENIKINPKRVWSNLKLLKEELKAYNKKSMNDRNSLCSSPALTIEKIESIKSPLTKFSDAEMRDSDSKSNYFEEDKSVILSTVPTEDNKILDISIALPAESSSISNALESKPKNDHLENCASSSKQDMRNRLASDSSSNTAVEKKPPPAFLASLGLSSLNEAEAKAKIDRGVKKLEAYLAKLDKQIRELQAKELSVDDLDDEDSAYILEDRYKRKFSKTWDLLCKMKKRSKNLGSEIEKKFHFKGTRYPEINTAIERLINKKKISEKFPNFSEVYNTVKVTNEALLIGLDESAYEDIATEIFRDVIKELKRRRLEDSKKNFGSYLTDDFKAENDPATKDESLKRTLEANFKEGSSKMDKLCISYVIKQETNEENGEEEKISSDEEDEEDEKENDLINEEEEDKDPVAEHEHSSGKEIKTDPASEPELCDTDPNLPETDPASSNSEPESSRKKDTLKRKEEDDYVINVPSDSDASTDPGENASKRIRTESQPAPPSVQPAPTSIQPPPTSVQPPLVQTIEEDSDDFYDLPSL